jgi:hypothetical protein
MPIRKKLLIKTALNLSFTVWRYSKCRNGIKIILLTAYTKKSFSNPGAFQNLESGTDPNKSKSEITPPRMQCSVSEAVIRGVFSPSSALPRLEINGFRMKPLRIISRIAVTLVNNIQIPISDLGITLTRKKMFRKPKNTTNILLSSEKTPLEKEREYPDEANSKLI